MPSHNQNTTGPIFVKKFLIKIKAKISKKDWEKYQRIKLKKNK